MADTNPIRDLIQQAIDSLPPHNPDRVWLSFALENSETTPPSVLVLAVQTAQVLLGIGSGPFELPAGPSNPLPSAEPVGEVSKKGQSNVTEEFDLGVRTEDVLVLTATDVPVVAHTDQAPTDDPVAAHTDQAPTDDPVAAHTDQAPTDDPVVAVEQPKKKRPARWRKRHAEMDERADDIEGARPEPSHEDAEPTTEPEVAGTVFGVVPDDVADAVYASDNNGKITLDLAVVNDEAEELAALELGRAAEEAEAVLIAESIAASSEYIPTPLPGIPMMPPLESAKFIGSEPVVS